MRVFYLDKCNVCYFVEKIRDAEDFLSWVCHHPRLDPCYRTIEKYCDAQEDIAIPAWCPLEEVKTICSINSKGMEPTKTVSIKDLVCKSLEDRLDRLHDTISVLESRLEPIDSIVVYGDTDCEESE